jgi:hypothetical protein
LPRARLQGEVARRGIDEDPVGGAQPVAFLAQRQERLGIAVAAEIVVEVMQRRIEVFRLAIIEAGEEPAIDLLRRG